MLRRTIPLWALLALFIACNAPRSVHAEVPSSGPKDAPHGSQRVTHETESEQPDIMEPQAPLAIWTLIVFGGLMLLLAKYAWKPMMTALREREAHLENVLLDSEKARNEAEAIAAENRRQLAQAADQVRALIEEARKEAQVAAASIITKAQGEAEASRQRAEREIAGAKDQALMEIWSSTADLAVAVAGKVLSKELGEADHRRLVDVAMSELPANGREGSRS